MAITVKVVAILDGGKIMYRTKLCLGVAKGFGIDTEKQIRLFRQTGFEGFFTVWDEDIQKCRALADELGMEYQSVHAPFRNVAKIWKGGEEGENAVKELITCVRDCASANVPIMVSHVYIGFEPSEGPTSVGLEGFRRVVEEAKKLGVKIAFENTEGEEYLAALMDAFKNYDNVGFCWDTGHQMCYNYNTDMIGLYGDRLICTHINDNLGVRDFGGKITYHDDLHLLPFDGIGDWKEITSKLNKCCYNDTLTFELKILNSPNRHDNEKYQYMKIEQYIAEAYARACRVAALKEKKSYMGE